MTNNRHTIAFSFAIFIAILDFAHAEFPHHVVPNTLRQAAAYVPMGKGRNQVNYYADPRRIVNSEFVQPIGQQQVAANAFQNIRSYFTQTPPMSQMPVAGSWEGRCLANHSPFGYPVKRSYSNTSGGIAQFTHSAHAGQQYISWGDTHFPITQNGVGAVNEKFPEYTLGKLTGTIQTRKEVKMFTSGAGSPLLVIRLNTQRSSPSSILPVTEDKFCIYSKLPQDLPQGVMPPVAAAMATDEPVILPFYQMLMAGRLPRPQFQAPAPQPQEQQQQNVPGNFFGGGFGGQHPAPYAPQVQPGPGNFFGFPQQPNPYQPSPFVQIPGYQVPINIPRQMWPTPYQPSPYFPSTYFQYPVYVPPSNSMPNQFAAQSPFQNRPSEQEQPFKLYQHYGRIFDSLGWAYGN